MPLPRNLLLTVLTALLALASLTGCGAEPTKPWSVLVEVAMPPDASGQALRAHAHWLGRERFTALEDDGLPPDRVAGDGILTAELQGPPLRWLQLEVLLAPRPGGDEEVAYRGVERVELGGARLSYALARDDPPLIRRTSRPTLAKPLAQQEAGIMAAHLTWCVLILGGVWWLLGRSRRSAEPMGDRPWLSLAIWLVLAVAWTWPAAMAGEDFMVGRHFDLPGTVWSLASAPRLMAGLVDSATGWPEGGDYRHFDSFVLLPLASLLEALHPARLHGLLQIIGVTLSAFAAERFAKEVGARPPWTWLAGLGFGFSGLAANTLLEGHVYHLLDPWLPLFGLFWWRATSRRGTGRDGALAGLCFLGALLTSGYLGLAAALMGICFWVGSFARSGMRLVKPTAWAAGVAGTVAIPYAIYFAMSSPSDAPVASTSSLLASSLHLAALGPATMECDRGEHSMALAVSGVILATALLGSLLLRREPRWRLLLWTAIITTIMAFGPALAPDAHASWLPLPTGWLLGDAVRFPARLSWSALLCLSVLAALAGTAMERRHGVRTRILLLLAVLELLLFVRLPWRQQQLPAETPSALLGLSGPVLDLVPQAPEPSGELDNWLGGWICYDQAVGGHVTAEDCVAPEIHASGRYRTGQWITSRLLGDATGEAQHALGNMGFGAVVLHAGLFDPSDAARLAASLAQIGEEVEAPSTMEYLRVYRLEPGVSDPDSARAAMNSLPNTEISRLGSPRDPRVRPVDSLTLELVLQDGVELKGIEATLGGPQGGGTIQAVSDAGDHAGDSAGDGVLLARWEGPLPASTDLRLTAALQDSTVTLWDGPVYLRADDERLGFRVLPTQPPTAIPVAMAPAALSAPVNGWNGFIAALGWSLYLILLGSALFHRKHSL